MKEVNKIKEVFFEWEADSRYYEKKSAAYFRAITVLAFLISLLLFFLKEIILIVLVWIIYFVAYVRAVVPPIKTKYRLDKFGLGYYGGHVAYKQMALFSVVDKKHGQLIRIITNFSGLELNLVLPSNPTQSESVITFFKERVPFMAQIPKNEVEKLADFLLRITGLG